MGGVTGWCWGVRGVARWTSTRITDTPSRQDCTCQKERVSCPRFEFIPVSFESLPSVWCCPSVVPVLSRLVSWSVDPRSGGSLELASFIARSAHASPFQCAATACELIEWLDKTEEELARVEFSNPNGPDDLLKDAFIDGGGAGRAERRPSHRLRRHHDQNRSHLRGRILTRSRLCARPNSTGALRQKPNRASRRGTARLLIGRTGRARTAARAGPYARAKQGSRIRKERALPCQPAFRVGLAVGIDVAEDRIHVAIDGSYRKKASSLTGKFAGQIAKCLVQ